MTNVSRTTDSRQQDCSTLQTIPAASLHHGLGITRTPEKAMLVKSSPHIVLYELFTRRTAYAPSKHPQKIHYGDTANENKKKHFLRLGTFQYISTQKDVLSSLYFAALLLRERMR